MKNKKINIELDLEDLLGLKEPSKNSLEYDLNFIIENGMEEYIKQQEEHEQKKKEFIEMFIKSYYWELEEILKMHNMRMSSYNLKRKMQN